MTWLQSTGDFERDGKIAHSIAWDAGNRSMHDDGRKAWNELDWSQAVAAYLNAMRAFGWKLPE